MDKYSLTFPWSHCRSSSVNMSWGKRSKICILILISSEGKQSRADKTVRASSSSGRSWRPDQCSGSRLVISSFFSWRCFILRLSALKNTVVGCKRPWEQLQPPPNQEEPKGRWMCCTRMIGSYLFENQFQCASLGARDFWGPGIFWKSVCV